MTILTDALLDQCAARTATYDRENRFCQEDFDELRAAGYLLMAVPTELGGLGMTLEEVCKEERRLAHRSPATALALNMHVYWTGVAADLWRSGDKSLAWLLEEAVAGEVFAAGHGEAGNDFPLLMSTASAEKVTGGYRITAHKIFSSMSPVWTRLGLHALDTTDPTGPKIVHAFLPRETKGYRIVETWDTLGMRATRSGARGRRPATRHDLAGPGCSGGSKTINMAAVALPRIPLSGRVRAGRAAPAVTMLDTRQGLRADRIWHRTAARRAPPAPARLRSWPGLSRGRLPRGPTAPLLRQPSA